jgi:hypothetical protein
MISSDPPGTPAGLQVSVLHDPVEAVLVAAYTELQLTISKKVANIKSGICFVIFLIVKVKHSISEYFLTVDLILRTKIFMCYGKTEKTQN